MVLTKTASQGVAVEIPRSLVWRLSPRLPLSVVTLRVRGTVTGIISKAGSRQLGTDLSRFGQTRSYNLPVLI